MATQTKPEGAVAKRSPVYQMAAKFDVEPTKLVEVLRATVIKPTKKGRHATNEEIAAFVIVANQYDLNPFTKEIHAFLTDDGGLVPIVGIDGWSRIINRQPGFNGCEFIDEPFGDGKMPASITCVMHVKGRDYPVRVTERYSECHRDTAPWRGMPWRLLRHKAFMQCGRYAFSLAGIVDEDEARDILEGGVVERQPIAMPRAIGDLEWPAVPKDAVPVESAEAETKPTEPETKAANPETKPTETVPSDEPIGDELKKEILGLFKKAKWEPQVVTSFLAKWRVAEVQYLTPAQGKEVVDSLLRAVGGKK